jgi:Flp pilus assembly protein TadG
MNRKPLQQDNGQVVVLAALLMVVLLGVCAIAIDIGLEIVNVNHLKNMASASALAGATAKAQNNNVTDAVKACLTANSIPLSYLVPTSQVSPDPSITATSVQVSLSQPHSFFLAPILGYSATTITQSATATLGSSSGGGASPFDYAVFSDQQLKMYPNDYITGGVHCNSTVDLSGLSGSGGSYFTKGIEDIGGVSYNVSALNNAKTGPFNNNAQSIPIAGMPDPATIATNLYNQALALNHVVTAANWSGPNGTLQPNSGEDWNSSLGYQWTYSNGTFSMIGSNPKLLDGPWYFVGNLILYPGGDGLTVNGAVVVTGQIQLGGSKLLSAGSNGMAFYSLLGSQQYPNPNNQDCIFTSISSGTTSTTTGTFYAPYGTINFNGGVPVIVGSVIGKKVIATNNITVTYDSNNLSNQLLTGTKAPLRAYLTK